MLLVEKVLEWFTEINNLFLNYFFIILFVARPTAQLHFHPFSITLSSTISFSFSALREERAIAVTITSTTAIYTAIAQGWCYRRHL